MLRFVVCQWHLVIVSEWCTWWCRHVGLERVVWVMVVVRSWCYACQVLFLQNGIDHEDEGPRFPYKPWKHPRPRSYNKVLSSATKLWVNKYFLNTRLIGEIYLKIVNTAVVFNSKTSMLPVRCNHLCKFNFFIMIILDRCIVFWVFKRQLITSIKF